MLHPRAKLGDAPAQGSIPFLPPPHGARLWVQSQPPAPCITPQPAEDQPPRLPSRPRHASFLFLRGVVQLTMQRAALLLIPFLFLSRAQGKLIGKLLLLACLRSSFSCGVGFCSFFLCLLCKPARKWSLAKSKITF